MSNQRALLDSRLRFEEACEANPARSLSGTFRRNAGNSHYGENVGEPSLEKIF